MAKVQLMTRLLEEGYFPSRKEAEARLLAGEISVDGVRVRSNITIPPDSVITVASAPFIGKGGLKLSHALKAFGIRVEDRVCIDAGASTGGFTDCLVQSGAQRVYAVDVGYGQLTGSLRQNEKVINLERTNISDPSLLDLDPRPTLGTVDVSYLSLRRAVPYFREILHARGELVCLVKPLFEIDSGEARRSGRIREEEYAPLLRSLIGDLNALEEVSCTGLTWSPVTGNGGTREFFLQLRLGPGEPEELEEKISVAVEQVMKLTPYKK